MGNENKEKTGEVKRIDRIDDELDEWRTHGLHQAILEFGRIGQCKDRQREIVIKLTECVVLMETIKQQIPKKIYGHIIKDAKKIVESVNYMK